MNGGLFSCDELAFTAAELLIVIPVVEVPVELPTTPEVVLLKVFVECAF